MMFRMTRSTCLATTVLLLLGLSACQPTGEAQSAGDTTQPEAESAAVALELRGAPRAEGEAMQFPYAENFEGLKSGQVPFGWESQGDDLAFAQVSNDGSIPARSGVGVVHLSDDSPEDAAKLKAQFGERGRGMVLYSLFVSGERQADAYITLGVGDQSADRVVDVLFTRSGTVRYRSASGDLVDIKQYSQGVWLDVSVLWDTEQGSFVLSIDGVEAGSFPMVSQVAPTQVVFKVGANAKTGQSAYLDDLQMIFE